MGPGFWLGITQVLSIPTHPPKVLRPLTHRLQLYATWAPENSVCEVLDTKTSKKNTIATLVSDVVLLLTMLVGLLRLRQDGTMFGFGKFLWKQVGGVHLALTDPLYV